MKSIIRIGTALCLLLLIALPAGLSGQGGDAEAIAAVTKLINEDVKASLAGDTDFVARNYSNSYIEGTSYGTWMTKKEFMDTSSNQVSSRSLSDLSVDVFGDTAIARFRETYDALVQRQAHHRTVICTQIWNRQGAAWKLLATHCSQSQ